MRGIVFFSRCFYFIFSLFFLSSAQANSLPGGTQTHSSQGECYYLFKNKKAHTLLQSIDSLKFSTQTKNILKQANILYHIDLVTKTKEELRNIPQIGEIRLAEIERALSKEKLQLDMETNKEAEKLSNLFREFTPKLDIALLIQPIEVLDFSTQTWFALKSEKINYLVELLMLKSKEELSFGSGNLIELEKILSENGLFLGMDTGISSEQLKDLIAVLTDKTDLDASLWVQPIFRLELSSETRKAMERLDILYIGELVTKTRGELLGTRHFRIDMLYEVERKLTERALYLGMDIGMGSKRLNRLIREKGFQLISSMVTQTIDKLYLTWETQEACRKAGIIYIGDLLVKTEEELLVSPEFKIKNIDEIKKMLSSLNLHLGMKRERFSDPDEYRFYQMFRLW